MILIVFLFIFFTIFSSDQENREIFFHYLEKYSIKFPEEISGKNKNLKQQAFSVYKNIALIPCFLRLDSNLNYLKEKVIALYDARKQYRSSDDNKDLVREAASAEVITFTHSCSYFNYSINNQKVLTREKNNIKFFFDFDSKKNQFTIPELHERKNYINSYEMVSENNSFLHFVQFPAVFNVEDSVIHFNEKNAYILGFKQEPSGIILEYLKNLSVNIQALLLEDCSVNCFKNIKMYLPQIPIVLERRCGKLKEYAQQINAFNSVFFVGNNGLLSHIEFHAKSQSWCDLFPPIRNNFLPLYNKYKSEKLFTRSQFHQACDKKIISQKQLEKYGQKIIPQKGNLYELIIVALYTHNPENLVNSVIENYCTNIDKTKSHSDFVYDFYRFLETLNDKTVMDSMKDKVMKIVEIFFKNKILMHNPTLVMIFFYVNILHDN